MVVVLPKLNSGSSDPDRPSFMSRSTYNCRLLRNDPGSFWNLCVVFWDLSTKKIRFRIWWSICSFRVEWVSVKTVGSECALYCNHFMHTFQFMQLVENALLAKMMHLISRPDRKDAFGGFLPSDKNRWVIFSPLLLVNILAIVKRGRHSFDIDQLN